LETRLQSEDRIINIKTKSCVLNIDLLVINSVDEDIYESLLKKESKQEMVKRFMQRVI
jgi:hypothetical protein